MVRKLLTGADAKTKSGILGLDPLLDGGILKNNVYLLSGPAGAGKSIFSLQFLIEGVKIGENGVLLSLEESPEVFRVQAKNFGWPLEEYEKSGKIGIIKVGPRELKNFVDHFDVQIEDLLKRINAKRFVIDSLTPFSMMFKDDYKKREVLYRLIQILSEKDVTTLLMSEAASAEIKRGRLSEDGLLEFLADGVFVLDYYRDNDRYVRELSIIKHISSAHTSKVLKVEIGKKGMEVRA